MMQQDLEREYSFVANVSFNTGFPSHGPAADQYNVSAAHQRGVPLVIFANQGGSPAVNFASSTCVM